MQGLLPGVIAKPCPYPLVAFRSPPRSRVHASWNSAPTNCSFPLKKTTFPCLKNKDHLLEVSTISTSLKNKSPKYDLFLHKNRGPCHPRASKDKLFDLNPYPLMTQKPEWWWRTAACIPYLMAFYDHQYWTYAHPTNNPPPFLDNFESLTFPLLSAIFALPKLFLSCYAFFCWLAIVRQKYWPHFLRFHVINAILIGGLVQVIGISGGWFPSWFFPPHFWSAATFVFLITVLQCVVCAITGSYPDVPFVKDAAYLHADLR